MTEKTKPNDFREAAKRFDWGQVVANGGPPCFHIEEDGRFCGRTPKWVGHLDSEHIKADHEFVSLEHAMTEPNDFRSRTCGECAWARLYSNQYAVDEVRIYFECRHCAWQNTESFYKIDTPACPAFIPREREAK